MTGSCETCQICFACQGQEQVSGLGCGNCYTCQVGYGGPSGEGSPPMAGGGPSGGRGGPQAPQGPPGCGNRQPRPVFDWELRDLNTKLDGLLSILERILQAPPPPAASQQMEDGGSE